MDCLYFLHTHTAEASRIISANDLQGIAIQSFGPSLHKLVILWSQHSILGAVDISSKQSAMKTLAHFPEVPITWDDHSQHFLASTMDTGSLFLNHGWTEFDFLWLWNSGPIVLGAVMRI